jgi:4-amino-4-deoxy-L-arabinose transferase-like glycosyltransferase
MGVASVALLYAAVRRWFGPVAGLLAGTALALTPVAVVMFRFDNPDALLTLLLVAAGYATVRAVEKASWKWLALVGVLLGLGFLTKMLQAFLVLPGFALVYLVAAPTGLGRRIRDLLAAGVALAVSGGWFVLLVSLWPASSRPYIAGSTNNTLWQLAIGYNGLGRIFGGEGNGGGGGPGGGGGGGQNSMFGGSPGLTRMFGDAFGLEISWLLPAALVALVAILAGTWRAPRTDRNRAAAILWGGWVLITGLTFSYMSGTVHPYYAVALAPGVAAMVAIGARVLWGWRDRVAGRAGLAAMVAVSGWWDFTLLGRVSWAPGLRWFVLVAGVAGAAGLLVPGRVLRRGGVVAVSSVALVATGAASAAWGVSTAGVAHNGATPVSGPSGVSTGGGFGGFPGGGRAGRGAFPGGGNFGGGGPGFGGGASGGTSADGGQAAPGGTQGGATGGAQSGTSGNGTTGNGTTGNGAAGNGTAGSGTAGSGTTGSGAAGNGAAGNGATGNGAQGGGFAGGGFPGGGFGGGRTGGGPGGGGTANSALVTLLKATDNRWAAATNGSMQSAPLQLASGKAVMAIGGFTGSDPSPTLAEFQAYVKAGEIHYYIGGGGMGGGFGGRGGGTSIAQWVQQNYTATTVGGTTVYDLTKPTS